MQEIGLKAAVAAVRLQSTICRLLVCCLLEVQLLKLNTLGQVGIWVAGNLQHLAGDLLPSILHSLLIVPAKKLRIPLQRLFWLNQNNYPQRRIRRRLGMPVANLNEIT